jgi:hypothetical protein
LGIEYKFRARWKDTGKLIPDFMDQYTIDALNDDSFVVEMFTDFEGVYEGDIIQAIFQCSFGEHEHKLKGSVYYDRSSAAWYLETGSLDVPLIQLLPGSIKVVGNVADRSLDILCNKCKKKLPPLEPSEIKCPTGYLCRVCSGLDKNKENDIG